MKTCLAAILSVTAALSPVTLHAESVVLYQKDGVEVIRGFSEIHPMHEECHPQGDFKYFVEIIKSHFSADHFFKITVYSETQQWDYESTKQKTKFPDYIARGAGVDGFYWRRLSLRWKSRKDIIVFNSKEWRADFNYTSDLGDGAMDIRNLRVTVTDLGTKKPRDFSLVTHEVEK